jgi:type 1 glutamine amidotransferase
MKNILILTFFMLGPLFTRAQETRLLVFSATKGFRHSSIDAGKKAIAALCKENDFACDFSEDPSDFNDQFLGNYDALIFLNSTGDLFNESEQLALQKFIKNGGGWIGIHAATDAEYQWPWYGKLAGAYFESHPDRQEAVVDIVDRENIAMSMLPAKWKRYDEWYNFKEVNPEIHVLAYLDETSYKGGNMNNRHPIVWFNEFDGGRAFYTGFGHTDETFADPLFIAHLLGGIRLVLEER